MKIGFVRHGETTWNEAGRSQGHSDTPLNEVGEEQANKIGKRLAADKWDVMYSSDLLRAKRTAEIIARYNNIPHYVDKRLRERHGGKIEGTTEIERIEKWGKAWRTLDLGVESQEQMSKRGVDFFEEIVSEHFPNNVLIVSHGAFLKQMLRTLVPREAIEQSLANCSLTLLTTSEGQWHLHLHNCIKHM